MYNSQDIKKAENDIEQLAQEYFSLNIEKNFEKRESLKIKIISKIYLFCRDYKYCKKNAEGDSEAERFAEEIFDAIKSCLVSYKSENGKIIHYLSKALKNAVNKGRKAEVLNMGIPVTKIKKEKENIDYLLSLPDGESKVKKYIDEKIKQDTSNAAVFNAIDGTLIANMEDLDEARLSTTDDSFLKKEIILQRMNFIEQCFIKEKEEKKPVLSSLLSMECFKSFRNYDEWKDYTFFNEVIVSRIEKNEIKTRRQLAGELKISEQSAIQKLKRFGEKVREKYERENDL